MLNISTNNNNIIDEESEDESIEEFMEDFMEETEDKLILNNSKSVEESNKEINNNIKNTLNSMCKMKLENEKDDTKIDKINEFMKNIDKVCDIPTGEDNEMSNLINSLLLFTNKCVLSANEKLTQENKENKETKE